jgi:hypothetical protein
MKGRSRKINVLALSFGFWVIYHTLLSLFVGYARERNHEVGELTSTCDGYVWAHEIVGHVEEPVRSHL